MKLQILDLHEVKSFGKMNHYEFDLFRSLNEVASKKLKKASHDGDGPRLKGEKVVRLDFDVVFDEQGSF